jgi:hypothetical protein
MVSKEVELVICRYYSKQFDPFRDEIRIFLEFFKEELDMRLYGWGFRLIGIV